MDEISKIELRNYAAAGGFIVILINALIFAFMTLGGVSNISSMVSIMTAAGLVIFATILVVLGKRDLIALTFYLIATAKLVDGIVSPTGFIPNAVALCIFFLIVALLIVCAHDRKKWLLAIVPVIMAVMLFTYALVPLVCSAVLNLVIGLIALYFALALSAERLSLPLSGILRADEQTEFKSMGSVIGYLLFAMPLLLYAIEGLMYHFGIPITSVSFMTDLACGILLVIIGILMAAVAKMRFTSVMFICMGLFAIFGYYVSIGPGGLTCLAVAIPYLLLGIIALFRKETRILAGIMLIVYAVTYILSAFGVSAMSVGGMWGFVILNAIPGLIAIYLAFAISSGKQKLLKL